MYFYRNGLKCNVSAARVHAFEAIVPPIAMAAAFLGLVPGKMLADWAFLHRGIEHGHLLAFMTTSVLWIVWMAVCVGLCYGVFEVWCRPVDENVNGAQTCMGLFWQGSSSY